MNKTYVQIMYVTRRAPQTYKLQIFKYTSMLFYFQMFKKLKNYKNYKNFKNYDDKMI